MNRPPQILICDDDSTFHLAVKHCLKGKYECRSAYNGAEALTILKKSPVDVVLLDVQMRTPDEGLRHVPIFREIDPEMAIVMISGQTDFQTVRTAMQLGATDYVPKDFDPNDLLHSIARVIERRTLLQRRDQQNFEAVTTQKKHTLVGESQEMKQLRRTIEKLRGSSANVVITGETGTGKEVVARQLRGFLADGSLAPFVAIDSSTIQATTAESILFGHEKGAFTGAERATKGLFEEANGGIVYFDEIANMPLEIQAKLLRVLQEKEVTRLGSSRVIPLEFRVVCATNKDLEAMAKTGTFKDDLLQRLNVIPIALPPLRERRDDIPELAMHFLKRQPEPGNRFTFNEEAITALQNYPWPGNIRELSNLISYMVAMCDGPELDFSDLPPKFRDLTQARPGTAQAKVDASHAASFYDRVSDFENKLLTDEYARARGNVSRLAVTLAMDRSHLYTKLKEYGIHQKKS